MCERYVAFSCSFGDLHTMFPLIYFLLRSYAGEFSITMRKCLRKTITKKKTELGSELQRFWPVVICPRRTGTVGHGGNPWHRSCPRHGRWEDKREWSQTHQPHLNFLTRGPSPAGSAISQQHHRLLTKHSAHGPGRCLTQPVTVSL